MYIVITFALNGQMFFEEIKNEKNTFSIFWYILHF